ncbi:MAG: hypothetical protein PHX08_12610 [Lachnospiraceae bacterium]|nr:hypothetical protein [Lachnospiraceae bacterium]
MTKITNNFCGYLNVGDDTFAYNVINHVVTLLPTQIEQVKRNEVLDRIKSRDIDSPEYLFGVADNNYRIAMLRNGKFNSDIFGSNPSIQFGTPVIIKASGNSARFFSMLTAEWNNFHSITCCGGNINALCNPIIAVERPISNKYKKKNYDGAREIKIRPWDDYTRSVDFVLDGEKATLTISVSQTGDANDSEDMESYSLGKLNSFIRLSFENAQGPDKIVKYYGIVKSLIAILTTRNNIFFEVYLSQRNSDNQYFQTGVCKVIDHYENYSTRKMDKVVPIYNILDCVPRLIEKIANSEVEPLLALLPEDNKRAKQISITNVQDLCTALEVAYEWSKSRKDKDPLIVELKKQIKKTINEFSQTHDEIDVYKETTISSAFQYLDYTLKQKILTMYNENCDAVDAIILKWSLPQVDEVNIGSFVKLRNSKTHSGIIEWGDSANLYTAFLALVYACFFRYIGLSNEVIKSALLQIF